MSKIRKLLYLMLVGSVASSMAWPFDAYHAHTAYAAGDRDTARALLSRMVVNNPADWRAFYNRGTLALQDGAYAEAVAHFGKALELVPDNESVRERHALAQRLLEEQERKKEEKQDSQKDKDRSEARDSSPQDQQQREEKDSAQGQSADDAKSDNDEASQKQGDHNPSSPPDSAQQHNNKSGAGGAKDDAEGQREQGNKRESMSQNQAGNKDEKRSDQEKNTDDAEERGACAPGGDVPSDAGSPGQMKTRAETARAAYQAAAEGDMTPLSAREQRIVQLLEENDEHAQRNLLLQAYHAERKGGAHASLQQW